MQKIKGTTKPRLKDSLVPDVERIAQARDATGTAVTAKIALAIISRPEWHPSDRFLFLFAKNEDSPQSHRVIADHIESCESCRKRLNMTLNPTATEATTLLPQKRPSFMARLRRFKSRGAAPEAMTNQVLASCGAPETVDR